MSFRSPARGFVTMGRGAKDILACVYGARVGGRLDVADVVGAGGDGADFRV